MNPHDNDTLMSSIGEGYRNMIPVAEQSGAWEFVKLIWEWYSSYMLGTFLAIYGMFMDSLPDLVSVGGFILLVVRLIADGPRAYKVLKDKVRGK